jgi:hypothetical protein
MRGMKAVFRSLLLWLLLLAIPFQGVASAGMLLCAPGPGPAQASAPLMAAGHDHAAMLAAAAEAHAAHGQVQADGADSADGGAPGGHGAHDGHNAHDARDAHDAHGPAKCGTTGACCVGAALAPALPGVLPVMAASSQSIPFYSGQLPAVDLALPERPPQPVQV